MHKYHLVAALAGMFLAACGPSAGASDAGPADPCVGSATRCVGGNLFQQCVSGFFEDVESCGAGTVCAPDLGCAACDPRLGNTCMGAAVHVCNPDGTVGAFIESCDIDGCSGGTCGGDACAGGQRAQLIYVVDDSYQLYSFDPRNGVNLFATIGNGGLSCPATGSWSGWDSANADRTATPFSMSVDRNADAWVLYTSGQIFKVSTVDASCQATSFVPGQLGFELFGMGFSSDSPGSQQETLFVTGGAAGVTVAGNLGSIDSALLLSNIGALPTSAVAPELSGTGDAELFAYYPDTTVPYVASLNKGTGQLGQQWNMPSLAGVVRAWAFAHWGGRFYIFVTVNDLQLGRLVSDVWLLDPMNGNANKILGDTGNIIVGAGVSTCAPVIVE